MIEIPDTLMDRALFDDDALIELSAALRPARVERLDGKIVVSPGTGGETGRRNSRLTRLLAEYAETHDFVSFDSSTGFHKPDHDTPSAGHALLRTERWAMLSAEQKAKLPPVAPGVVVELCSENERAAPDRDEVRALVRLWRGLRRANRSVLADRPRVGDTPGRVSGLVRHLSAVTLDRRLASGYRC